VLTRLRNITVLSTLTRHIRIGPTGRLLPEVTTWRTGLKRRLGLGEGRQTTEGAAGRDAVEVYGILTGRDADPHY